MLRPVRHMTSRQLEATVRRVCARLRYDISRNPADAKLELLVRRLNLNSPLFSRIWNEQEFTVRAYGVHRFTHARFGPLSFEHYSYVPDGHPNIRVVTCIPKMRQPYALSRSALPSGNSWCFQHQLSTTSIEETILS